MANYTVELNIGSLSTPSRGTGWVVVNPYLNNAQIGRGRAENQIFSILQFGGTLKFKGEEYTTLKTLVSSDVETPMRVKINNTVKFSGELILRSTYNEDEYLAEIGIKTLDEYYNILDNYNTRINIKGNTDQYSVYVDAADPHLEYSYTQYNVGDAKFRLGDPVTGRLDVYARLEITVPDSIADQLVSGDYYLISNLGTGYSIIGINWDDAGYSFPVGGTDTEFEYSASPPPSYNLGDKKYITSRSQYGYYMGEGQIPTPPQNYFTEWLLDEYYTGDTITYTRYLRLDETIQYMINEIDDSIQFDSNSFNYFDNNVDLANLMIDGISNTVPNDVGSEKSVPQTIAEMTLEDLFNFMRDQWRIFWELELVGNQYYFRIKHATEVLLTTGTNPDFTNYKDRSWTVGKNTYQYDAKERYNRIVRDPVANGLDFLGADIEMPDITTETKRNVSFSKFFFDITDILNNPDKYPGDSKEQFVILSCGVAVTADYGCRITQGELTNLTYANNDLSVANTDENHGKYWLSDTNVIVNGISTTATQRRYQNQVELDVPVTDWEEIDFTELVTTGIGDTEPLMINVDLNKGFAKYVGRI